MTAVQKESVFRWGVGIVVTVATGLLTTQQQINAAVLKDIRKASQETAASLHKMSERTTRLETLQESNADSIGYLRDRFERVWDASRKP